MKRGVVVAVGVGLAALLFFWSRHPSPSAEPRASRTTPTVTHFPSPPTLDTDERPSPPAHSRFREQTKAIEESCGLPLNTACDAQGCVSLMTAPDLDALTGWAQLVLTSPQLVVSTAMRDLGLPDTACGEALGALSQGTLQLEREDGTEVWCTIHGTSTEQAWEAGGRRLCDQQAQALGVRGFTDPKIRVLRF